VTKLGNILDGTLRGEQYNFIIKELPFKCLSQRRGGILYQVFCDTLTFFFEHPDAILSMSEFFRRALVGQGGCMLSGINLVVWVIEYELHEGVYGFYR
jgi:hypothetical protein